MEQPRPTTSSSNRTTLFAMLALLLLLPVAVLIATRPWEGMRGRSELDTIDLTTMNSELVFSYVNNMVNIRPGDYLGRSIKLRGAYYQNYSDFTGRTHHFVTITDAMACCPQGVEFWFDGQYPSTGVDVIIVGTFAKSTEKGVVFYYIDATECTIVAS